MDNKRIKQINPKRLREEDNKESTNKKKIVWWNEANENELFFLFQEYGEDFQKISEKLSFETSIENIQSKINSMKHEQHKNQKIIEKQAKLNKRNESKQLENINNNNNNDNNNNDNENINENNDDKNKKLKKSDCWTQEKDAELLNLFKIYNADWKLIMNKKNEQNKNSKKIRTVASCKQRLNKISKDHNNSDCNKNYNNNKNNNNIDENNYINNDNNNNNTKDFDNDINNNKDNNEPHSKKILNAISNICESNLNSEEKFLFIKALIKKNGHNIDIN
jgi:hypothetical protein